MYPISAAFAAAIASGYRIATNADITFDGETVVSGLAVSTGVVTVDRTAACRRTCSLSINVMDDLGIVPTDETSPIAGFGAEVVPSFGVTYPDGSIELVPMGIFVITTCAVVDTGSTLTLTLTGSDRSWGVSQRAFLSAYTPTESDITEAIADILTAQFPSLPPLNMAATGMGVPTGTAFAQGADPWASALSLAVAAGCELYMDLTGTPTGKPTPNPAQTTPCWIYNDTAPGLNSLTRTFSRAGVSNDFWVTGSGTSVQPPVVGEASDTNPSSPTYIDGTYGDIPTFSTSSIVATTEDATTAAAQQLAVALGSVEVLTLNVMPNVAFDIDDVISVSRPRCNVNGNYVIDTLSQTMRHDTATVITGRSVTA